MHCQRLIRSPGTSGPTPRLAKLKLCRRSRIVPVTAIGWPQENEGLNGGCIWDWIDQGVEATDLDGTVYYQFGGDWGDKVSRKNFSLNGLIQSDQSWTPKLAEVKKCYEPFHVKALNLEQGRFEVHNRLNQLSLEFCEVKWEQQAARHTIELPKEPTTTELRIAAKVSGVGNGSCGPPTSPEYRALAEPVEYSFALVPWQANAK